MSVLGETTCKIAHILFSLLPTSASALSTDCSMTCNSNSSEYCGGPNRLNLYSFGNVSSSSTSTSQMSNLSTLMSASSTIVSSATTSPTALQVAGLYTYLDCHTDSVGARALTGNTVSGSMMTIEYCASVCSGFTYMATEYSTECYCGNSLLSGSVTATDGRCNMVCSANSQEICGGPNGLSLYRLSANFSSAVTSASSATNATANIVALLASASTVSSTSSSTPTSTGPSIVQTAGSFSYVDCHTDNNLAARALEGFSTASDSMTVASCAASCSGFTYFGIEYAR